MQVLIVYHHASTHNVTCIYYYLHDLLLPTRSITCSVQKHLNLFKPLTNSFQSQTLYWHIVPKEV